MRRVLVDVNVVLDAVLDRQPHSQAATALWTLAEDRAIEAFVPAHGVTTIFYLLARAKDAVAARSTVESILGTFGVAAVDEWVLRHALSLAWPDFEDSVCAGAADAARCEMLVTRDPSGFRGAGLPVLDPATAVAVLTGGGPDRAAEEKAAYRRKQKGHRAKSGKLPAP